MDREETSGEGRNQTEVNVDFNDGTADQGEDDNETDGEGPQSQMESEAIENQSESDDGQLGQNQDGKGAQGQNDYETVTGNLRVSDVMKREIKMKITKLAEREDVETEIKIRMNTHTGMTMKL